MSYEIVITRKALTQLKKLDRDVQERIVRTLERMRVRPHRYVKRIVGLPYYRVRSGDYRIIVDIRENVLLVLVLEVGHRKKIYKR
jgi:mRNA interferase RelE/StbE